MMSTRFTLATFVLVALAANAAAQVQQKQNPYPDRTLLAADRGKIHILNASGESTWSFPIRSLHDIHRLPNGNILAQRHLGEVIEIAPDKKIVWSYDARKMNGNEGKRLEVHAFQRLANGDTMIAESGVGRIIEVDRAGKLKHQIKLTVEHPHPHRDTRLVRKLDNGHYLVCHEGDGKVREYDHAGKVVWEYAIPLFGKPRKGGHGPEAFGNHVFGAIRLPNGNTLIATGNGHSVIEVTPEKKIVWKVEQNDLKGITLAWVTTLELLPNGNIVIGNCHAGRGQPQVVEIDRNKRVVWSYADWTNLGDATPNSQVLGGPATVIR